MHQISTIALHEFTVAVLTGCGVPEDDAGIVADTIVDAHLSGKGTHGVTRLPIYVRKIRGGLMDPRTPVSVVRESPAIAVLDANHGFGQVAAVRAMAQCVKKAKALGVGIVGVRHSNNFGVAGYFARQAANEGFIGIVLGNSAPAIAPTGGTEPLLGTNPLAVAFPDGEGDVPIVLDMATSEVARGRIRLAARQGESIPEGWALDAAGNPTTDPAAALGGSMVPIGGAKGYGLSLVIDVLAGLLPGAAFAGQVKPLNHPDRRSDYGHWMMALDPTHFLDPNSYADRMATLVTAVRSAPATDRVWLPGERAKEARRNAAQSVTLGEVAWRTLCELSEEFGLTTPRSSLQRRT